MNKRVITILKLSAASLFLIALLLNVQMTFNGLNVTSETLAFATGTDNDDGTCSYVPPGYGCANKVLFPLQLTIQEPCEKKIWCWISWKKTVGIVQRCQTNSEGGRCSPIACDAEEPEC